jgi:hemoglobin-like flavoprotein
MSDNNDWKKYALLAGAGLAVAGAAYFLFGSGGSSSKPAEVPFPLVHKTWRSMLAKCDGNFGSRFYPNLFANPGVKETYFFTTDKPAQQMNLTKGITAVLGLVEKGDLPGAFGALNELGLRHVAYLGPLDDEIKAAYGLVGATVIKTLKETLGAEFTPEAESQWGAIYGIVCDKCYEKCGDTAAAAKHLRTFYQNRLRDVSGQLLTDVKAKVAAEGVDATAFWAALPAAASEGSLAPLKSAAASIANKDKFAAAALAAASTPYEKWCVKSTIVAALARSF